MWRGISNWLESGPTWAISLVALFLMALAAGGGILLRIQQNRRDALSGDEVDEQFEGYIVSAVLGLLALLMGFTFSMAVDRFDARRLLVLEEANAIGTTYLRTQLMEEPHRTRISRLLVAYTDNRLELAKATSPQQGRPLLLTNDRLVTELWVATVAAWPTLRDYDFSSAYVESMNTVIDLDASRKAARLVRVPPVIFVVLFIYMFVTAGVMGYVLHGDRGRAAGGFMLVLLVLALALIFDIDRPMRGGVTEGQGPMERLRASLHNSPPSTYDRLALEDANARMVTPP
jgi:hypothetical protein